MHGHLQEELDIQSLITDYNTSGTSDYTIMPYWSRSALGLLNSQGKQVPGLRQKHEKAKSVLLQASRGLFGILSCCLMYQGRLYSG